MASIKEIDKWFYNLNENKKFDIMNTISPDILDDDFWEHLPDDLRRSIYEGHNDTI